MQLPKTILKTPFNITRASHVVLSVRDLQASRAFYVDMLGFAVSSEDKSTLFLRGMEEACHHSLILEQSDGEPRCQRVGMRVLTEEDLDLVKRHFEAAGLPAAYVERPHQTRTLHASDPLGTPLEFCVSMKVMPRLILSFDQTRGASPQRLDHYQVLHADVPGACEFYMGLGFRLSEYVTDEAGENLRAIFLQRKGNPHDIVFVKSPGPRLHHAAFVIPESYHLFHLCDVAATMGFGKAIEWGPGRHYGPGYARFVYLRDPDGHRVEMFNSHYQTIDAEDEPLRFIADDKRWGTVPPTSWREEASRF